MNVFHIIGRKNHGKTSLVLDLIEQFLKMGLKVGTIKHTCHDYELDTPGKDSCRMRLAGAAPTAIITPSLIGVYTRNDGTVYDKLLPQYESCDLVIIEGNKQRPGPKFEIWRKEKGSEPLAGSRHDITALISDDEIETDLPVWPRSRVDVICSNILACLREDKVQTVKNTNLH